jgi:hypothetical protein
VRGPSALAHACCIDRWYIQACTGTCSGLYVLSGLRACTHTGPSGVAEAPFVRFACTALFVVMEACREVGLGVYVQSTTHSGVIRHGEEREP